MTSAPSYSPNCLDAEKGVCNSGVSIGLGLVVRVRLLIFNISGSDRSMR